MFLTLFMICRYTDLDKCVCSQLQPVCLWPVEQGVVGSFEGLVLLRVLLQPGVVLQQLLHVGLGALHLQHLGAQLTLQVLTAPLCLLQQSAQLTGLQQNHMSAAGNTESALQRLWFIWHINKILEKKSIQPYSCNSCVNVTSASAWARWKRYWAIRRSAWERARAFASSRSCSRFSFD